ncbi:MAG: c-type cytochrome [Burkholderiaceae bacterium]
MKFRWLLLFAGLWAGSAIAADAGQALAQRSICLSCHQVDAKRVGPSFRDIAIRYSGNEAAAEYLARTIRDGSRGLWGAIPMPAQRHVDPATALQLAEWIMSLAPARAEKHGSATHSPPAAAGVGSGQATAGSTNRTGENS